jgi:hypothetical protein
VPAHEYLRGMGHAGSWEGMGANTLDTEESPNVQRYSTHPYELGYEARRIFLGHHERGRGIL